MQPARHQGMGIGQVHHLGMATLQARTAVVGIGKIIVVGLPDRLLDNRRRPAAATFDFCLRISIPAHHGYYGEILPVF